MKELILDARRWRTADEFYDSFFAVVGAPSWHGRNFDALRDSISVGGINSVELPYRIVITGLAEASHESRTITEKFIALIQELAAQGNAVEIAVV